MEFKKGKHKEPEKYPHQIDIENAVDKIEKNYGSFSTIIDLPTGGGKTRIATDLCVKELESNPANKVLWLSDSIDLLIQSIDRFGGKSLSRDISYQLICCSKISFDGKRWKRDCSNPINNLLHEIKEDTDILFASVETIRGYMRNNETYSRFFKWLEASQKEEGKLVIIYDEVHHIGAKKTEDFFRELFETANREEAIIKKYALIGLTATVYRYDSPVKSFNRWFKQGWNKHNGTSVMEGTGELGQEESKFINNRISITDIQTLIDEGRLMKPTIIRVDDFKDGKPDDDEEMEYLARKIAKTYDKEKWNKTIIFVGKIKQANDLQKRLSESGVECFAYTSQNENDKIEEHYTDDDLVIFKKENSKNYKIMITCDMVSEGFDVRDLETVYLYSGIQSQILLRQRIGRVLRCSTDKKKATVYWQKYFPDVTKTMPASKIRFNNVIESDQEIQKDICQWKKGMHLPAGMYLEALPVDDIEEKEFYMRAFLVMSELFGAEELPNMNYFECDGYKIYFGRKEQKGYEQFFHIIYADYWSCLIYKDKYEKFDDYAKALGVKKNVLIEDIKINCFYLDNVSEKDTTGNIIKEKRFCVKDGDIVRFYEWVVKNDLRMPKPKLRDMPGTKDSKVLIDGDVGEPDGQDFVSPLEDEITALIGTKETKEYVENYPQKKKQDLLEAIQLQQEIKKSFNKKRDKNNRQKVYPDMFRYGKKNKYIYQQLLSARAIIENGAAFEKREMGNLGGVNGELALIAKNQSGEYYQVRALARTVNDIADGDTLFLAQALITVPNHITVIEEDVEKYSDCLLEVLKDKCSINQQKEQKIVNEFIMALGYHNKRNDIIRMQCELFGSENLPRLLQYVIYCECYQKLSKEVDYYKNNELVPTCQNRESLTEMYEKNLEEYGIKKLDDNLAPIEDVIEDYRPYIKAVPYYQGIKPEFLCRMLNDMLSRGDKKKYEFYDTFGGSGTMTLNMSPRLELKKNYNDLGIFNKSFFDVLKNEDCCKKLKAKVKEFIELIINDTGDDSKTQEFFKPYMELLELKKNKQTKKKNCIDKLKETIESREKEYRDTLEGTVGEEKIKDVEKRLSIKEEQYQMILKLILVQEEKCNKKRLRDIERHLHIAVIKIGDIFNELKGDDYRDFEADCKKSSKNTMLDCTEGFDDDRKVALAFIFYIFNFIRKRAFYNSADIQTFARLIGSYEKDIDNAKEIFSKVECYGRDALELIEAYANQEQTVWYHDIPYSGTSADNYVEPWFDEVGFIEALSKCAGDYIVASRFNICEKEKEETNAEETNTENNAQNVAEKRTKKQYDLVKFFSRFVTADYCEEYKQEIEKEYKEIAEKAREKDKEGRYVWNHIEADKKAKYIAFAFSRNVYRKHYEGEDESDEEKKYISIASSVSEDSVRRMLNSTQFTDNSVEVMITNMELNPESNARYKNDNKGMWCFPTFKTPSAYMVEPVTIIMSYETFYEKMVLNILSHAYEEVEKKDFAAAFRDYFLRLKKMS